MYCISLDYLSGFDSVCYILIVGLNYVKSDYLLLTNSNPSSLLGKRISRMMY
jgi:hypothetical protein